MSKGVGTAVLRYLVGLLIVASPFAGCTRSYSVQMGPAGVGEDLFPAIRRSASETLEGVEAGLRLRVRHTPGDEAIAAEALRLLRLPVAWLEETTGRSANHVVEIYIAPAPDHPSPFVLPKGTANFTDVLFYDDDGDLLSLEHARKWYFQTFVHEASHLFLAGLPLRERWLEDGLPEYLAYAYSRERAPDTYWEAVQWTPPVVALSEIAFESWDGAQSDDPVGDLELAYALGLNEAWQYAAAGELVGRWMQQARARGIESPVADLLRRIEARAEPVDWPVLLQVAHEQAGVDLMQLAKVTEEERREARARAWEHRSDPKGGQRIHALRTLAFFGLPGDAEPKELVALVREVDQLARVSGRPWPWGQLFSATGAIATSGDPTVASAAARALKERWPESAYRLAPAEFWALVASTQSEHGLPELVNLVGDSQINLFWREQADRALVQLTGKDVGWSTDLDPRERRRAAERWREALQVAPAK